MSDQPPHRPQCKSWAIRYCLLGAASLAGAAVCERAAGPTLGVFIGGFFVATFLTPAAALAKSPAGAIGAVVGPVAGVWTTTVFQSANTWGQWGRVSIVLAAYAIALGGIAAVLRRIKAAEVIATAVAVVLGLAWLTWPIWLAPNLTGPGAERVVSALARIHPPLVANGILANEPAWTERSLAYHLTNLNQDIPLLLPNRAAPSAGAHLLAAAALWGAAMLGTHRKRCG